MRVFRQVTARYELELQMAAELDRVSVLSCRSMRAPMLKQQLVSGTDWPAAHA